MSIYNILGYLLISLPFIGIGVFVVKTTGWKDFFTVLGIIVGVLTLILVGAHLITLK